MKSNSKNKASIEKTPTKITDLSASKEIKPVNLLLTKYEPNLNPMGIKPYITSRE